MSPQSVETHSRQATAPSQSAAYVQAACADYRLLRRLMIFSLVLGSAGCFAFDLVDADLWGHVKYGQDWIADGHLHRTATHTFTAEGYRWVNHENLAELAFAYGFDRLGMSGLLVGKCLLGMAILGLMYWVARWRDVRHLTIWVFLILIAVNLKAFFPMRPQLLSFLCCAVLLTLLEASFFHWRRPFARNEPTPVPARPSIDWRPLAFVPVVLVVWVNSHGGFAAGIGIACAYLFGRFVEMLIDRRPGDTPRLIALCVVATACLLTVLANPYGPGLVQWMAESLGTPRPEITEWAPPKISDPNFWQVFALVAVNLIAWTASDKRRDWVKIVIFALVAWQAISHVRHIAFFAILSGFWTLPHLQSVLAKLRGKAAEGLPIVRPSPIVKWGAIAAVLFTTYIQTHGLANRLVSLRVDAGRYPVNAMQFMADNELSGRIVVSFNWAQYAIAAFSPESTVAFDGRFRTCYPQEVVDMHFDFLLGENDGQRSRSPKSGAVDGSKVLEHGSPNLVIVDRSYTNPVKVMQENAVTAGGQWSLLYQDSIAQVWGRASLYDSRDSASYFPRNRRSISDRKSERVIPWPALPRRTSASLAAHAGGPTETES